MKAVLVLEDGLGVELDGLGLLDDAIVDLAGQHVLMHDVEVVIGGVVFVVGPAVEGDAGHVDAGSIEDALIIGGRSGEIALVMINILQDMIRDTVEQMVMLAGSLIFLALLFSILLTRQSRFSVPAYQTGDIARADIIIPTDMLIEDEAATEARRAAVKAKTFPVYRFNPSLPDDQISGLKTAFGKSRT